MLARRIGRNELDAIATMRAYVAAQRRYAEQGHDGRPAGAYAVRFRSDPGKQNGLYWPAARGEKRSPLGDLVAEAAEDGRGSERGRTDRGHDPGARRARPPRAAHVDECHTHLVGRAVLGAGDAVTVAATAA